MIRRIATLAMSSLFLAVPAHAALQAGTTAPDFTAQASLAGRTFVFSLQDAWFRWSRCSLWSPFFGFRPGTAPGR